MLNLIPQKHNDLVRGEYVKRFFTMFLFLFGFILLSLCVFIFPSYTSIKSNQNILENNLTSLRNSSISQDKDKVLAVVDDLKRKTSLISMVEGEKPSDYFDKVLSMKTNGISFTNISYNKRPDKVKEISVQGVADSRLDLISFSKKTKQTSWVVGTDIPVSNLASDKNIPFSITFTATSTNQ